MKKELLCLVFMTAGFMVRAQRFFFIEGNSRTNSILQEQLIKSAQFVTSSPLASDFIINTSFEFLTGSDVIAMKVDLRDSLTREIIFQSSEELTFSNATRPPATGVRMAIESFINRNIDQFIYSANEKIRANRGQYLKARKDKT